MQINPQVCQSGGEGAADQSAADQQVGLGRFAELLLVGNYGKIRIGYTNAASGSFDLSSDPFSEELQQRREALTGLTSVSWLRQEHGTSIEQITQRNPQMLAGSIADAAITDQRNHAVSVITADCAPIALWTNGGVVGAVHAGWKGLHAGIIEQSIAAVRKLSGEDEVFAWLGPCIGPECYEFGAADLALLAKRYGPRVCSVTAEGLPAFDMTAGVRAAAGIGGAHWAGSAGICTACSDKWFSWRARKSAGRQALFVWCQSGTD